MSAKHLKKVEMYNIGTSLKHLESLSSSSVSPSSMSGSAPQPAPLQLDTTIIVCPVCNVPCAGVIPYNMHTQGKKHLKKMNKLV
jgi:hypothetical protein